MTSVGKKLGISFSRNRTGFNFKKSKNPISKDELDLPNQSRNRSLEHISPGLNLGGTSPHLKTSKSNSLGSIDSEGGQPLDHQDIWSLTNSVRSFSEALGKLKAVFTPEKDEKPESLRVKAYDKLGEVLCILKLVLNNYPSLHSVEMLYASATLITKIKSCQYVDIETDAADLVYCIDQLAVAFSSCVSEYLMGDGDSQPRLGKARSYENLISDRDDTMGIDLPEQSYSGQTSCSELDQILHRMESGIDIAMQRAKAWAKYAKDIITYVEKRTNLDAEYSKSLSKLAHNVRQAITEDTFLPFQSVYCTALEQDSEYANTCQSSCTLLQTNKFIEPLNTRRLEHEKIRKNLKDLWSRELRKMHDAVSNLKKAKSMYITRYQEYDKSKEASSKAESESLAQSSNSGLLAKVEKRKRQEEDALHKAMEAESTYKACVSEANFRQQDMERVKGEILAQIRDMMYRSDLVMKNVTVNYFNIQHTVNVQTPVQFQTLCESSHHYDCGTHYAEYVKRLPVSDNYTPPDPYVFEPYNSETRLYELRKPSTQSSGSGSDAPYGDESPSISPRHHRGGREEDTDSINSSSSMKSHESSPSASPFQAHRTHMVNSASMNELTDMDREAHSGGSVSRALTFRGTVLSRPAQSHAFRKLRSPSRCRECESYVYFQGAECEKCGLSSHKKCLECLRWECGHNAASIQRRMTTFGVDFSAHVEETHTEIPSVVRFCAAEIDNRGLDLKGVYRMSGVKSKVESLCQSFESDPEHVDLSDHQPHVIANVLKLYLRQLPEPLLTFDLYPNLVQLAKDEQNRVVKREDMVGRLTELFERLPKANRRTLCLLMHHLQRVCSQEHENQMSASNLGIVFGPTLLRPSEGAASLNSLIETPHHTRIVELLILNATEICGPDEWGPEDSESGLAAEGNDTSKGKMERDPSPVESKWLVPEITENLLDELAKEEPRFTQVNQEYVQLPGSLEVESKMQTPLVAEVQNAEILPADNTQEAAEDADKGDSMYSVTDDIDILLPDDSSVPVLKISPPDTVNTSQAPGHAALCKTDSADSTSHSSPGLRKKLLPSQVIGRSSSSSLILSTTISEKPKKVVLTEPKPFSPASQRRSDYITLKTALNKSDETGSSPGSSFDSVPDDIIAPTITPTTTLSMSKFYTPSPVLFTAAPGAAAVTNTTHTGRSISPSISSAVTVALSSATTVTSATAIKTVPTSDKQYADSSSQHVQLKNVQSTSALPHTSDLQTDASAVAVNRQRGNNRLSAPPTAESATRKKKREPQYV